VQENSSRPLERANEAWPAAGRQEQASQLTRRKNLENTKQGKQIFRRAAIWPGLDPVRAWFPDPAECLRALKDLNLAGLPASNLPIR
jgi:hypothetical protein